MVWPGRRPRILAALRVLREGPLVRVRILGDISSRVGGWKAAAAETVGITSSAMENTRSAASGKDEN
jgi:hypothetical protein